MYSGVLWVTVLVMVNDSTAAYGRLQCWSVTVQWFMVSYIANQCYVQGSTVGYHAGQCLLICIQLGTVLEKRNVR